jgi:hypothetical protein
MRWDSFGIDTGTAATPVDGRTGRTIAGSRVRPCPADASLMSVSRSDPL